MCVMPCSYGVSFTVLVNAKHRVVIVLPSCGEFLRVHDDVQLGIAHALSCATMSCQVAFFKKTCVAKLCLWVAVFRVTCKRIASDSSPSRTALA